MIFFLFPFFFFKESFWCAADEHCDSGGDCDLCGNSWQAWRCLEKSSRVDEGTYVSSSYLKQAFIWGVKLTHVHSIQETHRLSFVLRGFSHTHFHGGFRSQLRLFQGGSLPDPDDERGLHTARGTWGWSRPGDNLVLHFTAFSGIRNSKSGFYKWKFCSLAVSWVNRAGRKTDNHSHSTKSNHSSSTQRFRCTIHTSWLGGNPKPGQLLHNKELSTQQYSNILVKQT